MTRLTLALLVVPMLLSAQEAQTPTYDVVFSAPTQYAPGAPAGFRVTVMESKGVLETVPVSGQEVEVSLGGRTLYSGKTNSEGVALVGFDVPELDEGSTELEIKAGGQSFKQKVTIASEVRILLVSDKPIYQPMQKIHLRALALDGVTLRPVGGELQFEVEDAKGNKIFKQKQKLSKFGVASTEFQLADEIGLGHYRLRASVGKHETEKTVEVKKYVLPKFKVKVKTDKGYYRPGEKMEVELEVRYFFGKPVAGGDIEIKASKFDVGFNEFAQIKGKTDEEGKAKLEVELPESFVGQPLEQGKALVKLEVKVTDTADHAETTQKMLPVTNQDLEIGVVPESGKVVPGVENRIYVVVTKPSGEPVEARLKVKVGSQQKEAKTNNAGYAELVFEPKAEDMRQKNWNTVVIDAVVEAQTDRGEKASKKVELSTETAQDNVLVRTDKAIYKSGEVLEATLLATFGKGVAFFDVVRKGQTYLTSSAPIEKGKATQKVTLGPDVFGAVELHAYVVRADGNIVRDTKVIYVEPPSELKITIETDKGEYRPAQEAVIRFRVTDKEGRGVEAALGVIIVDESVYALQEMQPGLAKIYFTLEQEIAKPKYQIKLGGGSIAAVVAPVRRDAEVKRQAVAAILMSPAEVTPIVAQRVWRGNTLTERYNQLFAKAEKIFWGMSDYILNKKKPFYETAADGTRALKAEVLEGARASAKLSDDDLKDPWGRPITLKVLTRLSNAFSVESWGHQLAAQKIQAIWQETLTRIVEHDLVVWENGAWKHRPGALALFKADTKDAFGETFTLSRLAKESSAFAAKNLSKLTHASRKNRIYNALTKHAAEQGGIRYAGGRYRWEEGLLDRLDLPEGTRSDLRGKRFDLDTLAADHPEFKPDPVAGNVDQSRLAALHAAMNKAIQEKGLDSIIQGTEFRKGVFDKLVEWGYITRKQYMSTKGEIFSLKRAEFAPKNFLSLRMLAHAQAISRAVCQHYHNGGGGALPEDGPTKLVDLKRLKAVNLRDPWGREYRTLKTGKRGGFGCGLMQQGYQVVSAGPDGKFGTGDDIADDVIRTARGFSPKYGPQYGGDPTVGYYGGWGPAQDGGDELQNAARLGMRLKSLQQERSVRRLTARGGGGRAFGGKRADRKGKSRPAAKMEKTSLEPMMDPAAPPGGVPFIRVREYFPETLAWRPSLITDPEGHAELPVQMADSITEWRLTASANSMGGLLGGTTRGIKVFQDFFVDIDFPVALTQNDTVSVPVAVYNYLKTEQTVQLEIEEGSWYSLEGDRKKDVVMGPGEVRAVYFPITVKKIGRQKLTVRAIGSTLSDAVRREVDVVPDGKRIEQVVNDRLKGSITQTFEIPAEAIDDSFKIICKCYPGVFSQIMEGVDGMLGAPHG